MSASTSAYGKPIFLIGYMASGKTTLGRALSDATGRRFIDLDDYISAGAGMSIPEIFERYGESAFREMETCALVELVASKGKDCIVACGGGTPCFGTNMELMSGEGLTVWLNASTDTILRRLREDRANRPLVAKLDGGGELECYIAENLRKREPFYSRAAVRFDSSRLESETEIAESVTRFIEMYI